MTWLLIIMLGLSSISTERLEDRRLMGLKARHCLITFAQLNTPAPDDLLNPWRSRFVWKSFHYKIGEALARVRDCIAGRGGLNRLEIELPPRMGKSTLAVRNFAPWITGQFPHKSGIVVTHTDHLAWEHGRDVRDIMRGPGYRLAFGGNPKAALRDDSQARDRLETVGGAELIFSGRGGLGAGVGADWMLFDDFFKNSEEATSETVRNEAWRTFIADCQSRLNNDEAPVVLIGTRRHEDDVQGRLFDPSNEHYDETEAKRWVRIRLPALAEENDPLGRKVDEPLWPERFSFDFYNRKRTHKSDVMRMDFQVQDQCNPIPEEGDYFKKKWLMEYEPGDLPKYLRFYAASDHAYRKDQKHDRQCLLVVGIDPSETIWVLPDTWWQRAETDVMVDAMIGLIKARQPACWWAARDAISGSVGPFLRKRMKELRAFAWVNDELREDKDLMRRAQSIRNRMAMGMVRFPRFAPWWGEARSELIAFPNGKHDDLVAALAMLGMGMDQMFGAEGPWKPADWPKPGTMGWVKGRAEDQAAQEAAQEARKGW